MIPAAASPLRAASFNVIIRAPLQSVYDVKIGVIGRQQYNRNPGRSLLNFPQQLKPTAIRQIDIQQDQSCTAAKQLLSRRFQVLAGNNLPGLSFQRFA